MNTEETKIEGMMMITQTGTNGENNTQTTIILITGITKTNGNYLEYLIDGIFNKNCSLMIIENPQHYCDFKKIKNHHSLIDILKSIK